MTVPEESVRELAALSGVVLGQPDVTSTLAEICRISVRAVPGTEGASVTTFDSGRPVTVASSDPWAQSLDELQYAEHEGPCLDCWRNGTLFRVRDLAEDVRWPSYAPRAAALGARSSVSLPMAAEGRVVGALNLYAREPDAFSSVAVSVAEVVAALAGLAAQVAAAFFGHRDLGLQLHEAMASRPVVDQACGVLMARHGLSADAALELLKARSSQRNLRLRDVARELVEGADGRAG